MKLKGKKVFAPNIQLIVFPRGEDDYLAFKFKAVESFDDFDKLVKEPSPPSFLSSDGTSGLKLTDETYLKQMDEYGTKKTNYMFLTSISATEDLEWEKVQMQNPETWKLWEEELQESGISEVERQRMMVTFSDANSLSDSMLAEARKSFLVLQAAQEKEVK